MVACQHHLAVSLGRQLEWSCHERVFDFATNRFPTIDRNRYFEVEAAGIRQGNDKGLINGAGIVDASTEVDRNAPYRASNGRLDAQGSVAAAPLWQHHGSVTNCVER